MNKAIARFSRAVQYALRFSPRPLDVYISMHVMCASNLGWFHHLLTNSVLAMLTHLGVIFDRSSLTG